jgi:hydroxymethylbilane synthase
LSARLRLATRGSRLALAQAALVVGKLDAIGVGAELVVVDTEGDRRGNVAIAALAGQGVFTKEVQAAVLDGRADVAVHSAKDLPSTTPPGLLLASVPERADPADALVGVPLQVLGPGATVATGAPRRRALLLSERPDLNVVGLRGNIETRLEALGTDGIDAVVVAIAALARLGLEARVAERLEPGYFIPQIGQGAIALECAPDADDALEALVAIDDDDAHRALRCERAFLAELGAGCELPGGAYATCEYGSVVVHAVLMSEDGSALVRGFTSEDEPELAGSSLAARLHGELSGASGGS